LLNSEASAGLAGKREDRDTVTSVKVTATRRWGGVAVGMLGSESETGKPEI
jgi:hypothetical protein